MSAKRAARAAGTAIAAAAALCAVLALLVAPAAARAAYTFELTGRDAGGYGDQGLWIGAEDWSYPDANYFNWKWLDVDAALAANGDLWISGTMEREYDAYAYGEGYYTWSFELHATEILLVGDTFAGHTGSYENVLEELLASGEEGARVDWRQLTMELSSPYDSAVPETGWIGLAMPPEHPHVAEISANGEALYFDAWYQNPSSQNYWYRVGDSKARTPPTGPIPEPGAAALFAFGLLVVARALRA